MKLVQVRECDGKCCKESPRFPNADRSDCIYRTEPDQQKGCALQRDPSLIPDGNCPVLPDLTAKQAFEQTCLPWPENSDPVIGETGDCCWQWVDDGD
jgi:hypothetical protein